MRKFDFADVNRETGYFITLFSDINSFIQNYTQNFEEISFLSAQSLTKEYEELFRSVSLRYSAEGDHSLEQFLKSELLATKGAKKDKFIKRFNENYKGLDKEGRRSWEDLLEQFYKLWPSQTMFNQNYKVLSGTGDGQQELNFVKKRFSDLKTDFSEKVEYNPNSDLGAKNLPYYESRIEHWKRKTLQNQNLKLHFPIFSFNNDFLKRVYSCFSQKLEIFCVRFEELCELHKTQTSSLQDEVRQKIKEDIITKTNEIRKKQNELGNFSEESKNRAETEELLLRNSKKFANSKNSRATEFLEYSSTLNPPVFETREINEFRVSTDDKSQVEAKEKKELSISKRREKNDTWGKKEDGTFSKEKRKNSISERIKVIKDFQTSDDFSGSLGSKNWNQALDFKKEGVFNELRDSRADFEIGIQANELPIERNLKKRFDLESEFEYSISEDDFNMLRSGNLLKRKNKVPAKTMRALVGLLRLFQKMEFTFLKKLAFIKILVNSQAQNRFLKSKLTQIANWIHHPIHYSACRAENLKIAFFYIKNIKEQKIFKEKHNFQLLKNGFDGLKSTKYQKTNSSNFRDTNLKSKVFLGFLCISFKKKRLIGIFWEKFSRNMEFAARSALQTLRNQKDELDNFEAKNQSLEFAQRYKEMLKSFEIAKEYKEEEKNLKNYNIEVEGNKSDQKVNQQDMPKKKEEIMNHLQIFKNINKKNNREKNENLVVRRLSKEKKPFSKRKKSGIRKKAKDGNVKRKSARDRSTKRKRSKDKSRARKKSKSRPRTKIEKNNGIFNSEVVRQKPPKKNRLKGLKGLPFVSFSYLEKNWAEETCRHNLRRCEACKLYN